MYELANLLLLLQALPNLDCIEIHSILDTLAGHPAFSGVKFTTVTTLCIPAFMYSMFVAFPNVQTLAFPSIFFSSAALVAAKNAFPRLRSLSGVQLADDIVVARLCKFPSLRAMTIVAPVTSHSKALLSRLADMKNLCELALVQSNVSEAIPLADNISAGTNVLRNSKGRGQKVLKVWEHDAAGDYRPHPTVILVHDE
ncbi:hypothetical protein B0H11DRAFT_2290889 [Mycena galericulata]|nr:hypothetical protein B0H11DRAFT_2290889 [Mycena galericulata]